MTLFGKLLCLTLIWALGMIPIIHFDLTRPYAYLWTIWMVVMVFCAQK